MSHGQSVSEIATVLKDTYHSPEANGHKRPRIWCLFGNDPWIDTSRGDRIGERRMLAMLTQRADVYYNGIPVWRNPPLPPPDRITIPGADYDLYYVRNNPEVFSRLPEPRFYLAYPHSETAFEMATGLVVTTQAWKRLLQESKLVRRQSAFFNRYYPRHATFDKPIVQFHQAVDPDVTWHHASASLVHDYKMRFTNRSAGFFGRLDCDLPFTALTAIRGIRAPKIPVIAAGKLRLGLKRSGGLPEDFLYVGNLPYHQMPNIIRSVDFTIGDESRDANYLGSNKVLDSVACLTPVLAKRNAVRDEYLGADYPGLFDSRDEALWIAKSWVENEDALDAARLASRDAAIRNGMLSAARRTMAQLEPYWA